MPQAGNKAGGLLAGADGFAEVYPEDKYIVVQHLQAAGHVTGMTGDGSTMRPLSAKPKWESPSAPRPTWPRARRALS